MKEERRSCYKECKVSVSQDVGATKDLLCNNVHRVNILYFTLKVVKMVCTFFKQKFKKLNQAHRQLYLVYIRN